MRPLTAVALAWTAGAALAVAAPTEDKGKTDKTAATAAEKIRKELDQTVTMDIDGQPLDLAINQLKEQTKVNLVLDRVALNNLGIDPSQAEVKLKLKDVKLRSGLRTLLNPYNLT